MSETWGELPSDTRLDRSHDLFYVQTVFVIVSGLCLCIRGYVKCFIVKMNLLDDYLLYGAMVLYIAYSAIVIDGSINGATGKHPSLNVTTDHAVRSLRAWYLCMVLYPWITFIIRASLCVLLLRLNSKRSYMWIIWINAGISAVISIAFFFVLVFQCSPPQYFWTQLYGEPGYCHNKLIVTYGTTVYSIISALCDWCLGLLPIAILWSVQINLRTKVAIAGLLSLGMVAGVVLIVRTTYITRLQPGRLFLYESIDVAIWSVMEPALGIIAACVATFRPLLKSWGFGWGSKRRGHSTHYQLPEQRRDGLTPATSPRERNVFSHTFEDLSDKSDGGDCGSEQELAIRKTVQIQVTTGPEPVALSPIRRDFGAYSPGLPGRAISCDESYFIDSSGRKSGYLSRTTV